MINSLKKPITYIFTFLITLLGFVPFFIKLIFVYNPSLNIEFNSYIFVMFIAAASLGLIGFIISDVYGLLYRKKTNDWDNEFSIEMKNKIWSIKMPFFLATINVALTGLIFYWSQLFFSIS